MGRFGEDLPAVPGFDVSSSSFRSLGTGADRLSFIKSMNFKLISRSSEIASYSSSVFAGAPQKLRFSVRSPGFEMYFPLGIQLKIGALSAPILTVPEASYGANTPANAHSWVLVTFGSSQPPLLLCFMSDPPEMMVSGQSGEWSLKSLSLYKGWVRVCLPFGLESVSASGVEALGTLAQHVKKWEPYFLSEAPKLLSKSITADESGLSVQWNFDSPGSVVPPAVVLCKAGGYKVQVLSDVQDLGKGTQEGPIVFCNELSLKVHFPANRVPAGRAIVLEPLQYSPPSVVPLPASSVAELALANLVGGRGDAAFQKALGILSDQPVPNQIDPLARALLDRSLSATEGSTYNSGAIVQQKMKQFDPMTMTLFGMSSQEARRSASFISVLSTLDDSPNLRAQGCWLWAGMMAQNVLSVYCQKRSYPIPSESVTHPFESILKAFYGHPTTDPFVAGLMSQLRVTSTHQTWVQKSGDDWLLCWVSGQLTPGTLRLMSSFPVELEILTNLSSLKTESFFGAYQVRYQSKQVGICQAKLKLPDWAPGFIPGAQVPRYREDLSQDQH